jgi:hypothetical protein
VLLPYEMSERRLQFDSDKTLAAADLQQCRSQLSFLHNQHSTAGEECVLCQEVIEVYACLHMHFALL